jgi:uncharacterized membrane protein YozB (DUF420 family)
MRHVALVELFGVILPVEVAVVLIGEIVVGIVLAVAFFLAATHRGTYHHWMVLSAFLFDELLLKGLMVQRLTIGALGEFPYEGTPGVPHIALSAIGTIAGICVIYLGFKNRVKRDGRMFLPPKGRKPHRIAGLVYLTAWTATFLLGLRMFSSFYL